ncbi:RsmB/NOP family class I SAM-dependent RNA methyltransferase [Chelatococcus reniformis]|uniref:MFS transporter n=1 Tax=Chelatococcus reniformis TaxID=1494448 RepID=A0A916UT59_9HYPH|nr:RsmB/NOP family class I SAM-dependent RNA methyltransferase [Chelatococcus reniformis]GGC85579.1 MFS transporter [Chelatococcus reniformis]
MTPGARIAAAVEVLDDIAERRRPAPDALKDWGLKRRFAGAKDRAAIASLVYDTLRRKASAQWLMGAQTPRASVLGMLRLDRGLDLAATEALFSGEGHAPPSLTGEERERFAHASLDAAPPEVAGDYPDWLTPALAQAFGPDAVAELAALAARAPIDLRANTLKATHAEVLADLMHLGIAAAPYAPEGLRIPAPRDGRGPSLQGEEGFIKGRFEVQDEGSQLATLLTGARPGEQVVDLCAGAGGKTLALAAQMENSGQIYATDIDGRRLAPLYARLERAGARNVQVRAPKGRWRPDGPDPLADLAGGIDLVVVDAPCTGTGTWRRNPDAKWRLRPGSLTERLRDQEVVLDRAAALVKPGGRIAYITCSLLPQENEEQIASFLARHEDFSPAPLPPLPGGAPHLARPGGAVQLTPRTTGTDGFFVAALVRR